MPEDGDREVRGDRGHGLARGVVLSVLAFVLLAVPMETYVMAFLDAFRGDVAILPLLSDHLFLQAAICFYSITLIVETMVVSSSPHLRGTVVSRPMVKYVSFVMIMISLLTYAGVKYAILLGEGDIVFIHYFLGALLVFSAAFLASMHAYAYAEYKSSLAVVKGPELITR